MKQVYIAAGVVAVLAWLGLGLFIAQGPKPEIVVPAEVITTVGPLNISNTMIASWFAMAVLIIGSLIATRSMKLMPSGFQNFFEAVVSFLVAQVEEIAGEKNGKRFFALVATIFLFLITSNWLGLLPFFNAIGKSEDVGHEIFHHIEEHAAEGHTFEEGERFFGWKMDDAGGMLVVKPRAKDAEFEVHAGEEPGAALDRYIVFLAEEFAAFEAPAPEGKPGTETVVAAARALAEARGSAPQLITAVQGEAHGVTSPALGIEVHGIDFQESQKLALVIPYFRGAFSDVNNTLAMGIIAFFMIEFWGIQALGFGYLTKFFNLNGVNAFVGILELLSEFIRIISFAFRLFGNIFAGEVLILMLTFLMPFLFVDIIYGLELFVGFIQAAVFALLTLVFATMAVEHHGEDEHHEGHHDEDAAADAHHHPGTAQAL